MQDPRARCRSCSCASPAEAEICGHRRDPAGRIHLTFAQVS